MFLSPVLMTGLVWPSGRRPTYIPLFRTDSRLTDPVSKLFVILKWQYSSPVP